MIQAAKIPPLALHTPTPRAPESSVPWGRALLLSAMDRAPEFCQNGKKKAMSCGEVLCPLIGSSCPLVGSMEEGVAGPAIKMTKGHQCMAENNILN